MTRSLPSPHGSLRYRCPSLLPALTPLPSQRLSISCTARHHRQQHRAAPSNDAPNLAEVGRRARGGGRMASTGRKRWLVCVASSLQPLLATSHFPADTAAAHRFGMAARRSGHGVAAPPPRRSGQGNDTPPLSRVRSGPGGCGSGQHRSPSITGPLGWWRTRGSREQGRRRRGPYPSLVGLRDFSVF